MVGIDLGTTNSAVSYADLTHIDTQSAGAGIGNEIKVFKVPQLTGPGEFSLVPVLPSFLYIPGKYDVAGNALKHPWKKENDLFAGVFAREHGAQVPSRLVSSAKSWLCHSRADREAPILPWGSQNVDKISPVKATSEYLRHIRKAWNHFIKDEDLFLENQFTVITVPASFDEAAREYTLKAAREAGFSKNITLLEEPLAAFYAWVTRHEHDWQSHVKADDLILVCDVGGGTTDFTLISLKEAEGSPRFERVAVGDHLILGGDNIDLTLARYVASKFTQKAHLTPDQWKTLSYKCRAAKEKLLLDSDENGDENRVRIVLRGEGRSLIANTLSADLEKEELEDILCQGFFPEVEPSLVNCEKSGKAIAEFGLPYEQEPAITRHIGWFLERHRESVKATLGKEPIPDHILFNGGSLKPSVFQNKIRAAIGKWFSCENQALPTVLDNRDPDLSVALGASYYGLVKQGIGVRVGSGSPRSYYIGIASDNARNKTCDATCEKIMCVVERGLDEGSLIALPEMEFDVVTNQPVLFSMFSSSFRSGDKSGDILEVDDSLTPLPPLKTIIKFGKKGESKRIPVKIEAEYTEMGTLAMWCRSNVSSHRWTLQFQLREPQVGEAGESEIYDDDTVNNVRNLLTDAFSGSADNARLSSVVKNIEKLVETKRNKWPLSFLRSVADHLIENVGWRQNSPEHEIRWLNLTGFCVRPGFGDAFDESRMPKLWKVYLQRSLFPKAKQNAVEWWIFCRRIAGGLTAGQQRQFFQDVSSYLLANNGAGKKVPKQEMTEVWMAAANMERLLIKDKIALSKKLIPQLKPGKTPHQMFWALSRIGARELLYGSVDRVVPAQEVERWTKRLMKISWTPKDQVATALAQILRKTGDRTRDVSQGMIQIIVPWFEQRQAPKKSLDMIQTVVPIESADEASIFGESLPQGLILRHPPKLLGP
ncbi:Hsp70 family protein [Desulfobacter latus]|uniref:Hsp70 family protein n=1 Tax=Desulfobacter latus TaxID=2292 RepID=UPI003CCD7D1B